MSKLVTKHLLEVFHQGYLLLTRRHKLLILLLVDILIFFISIYFSFWLRFTYEISELNFSKYSWRIFLLIIIKVVIFYFLGIYKPILRYTGLEFFFSASKAVLYSSGLLVIMAYLQGLWPLPRSVLIIDAILTLISIIGVRLLIRSFVYKLITKSASFTKVPENLVIYGAGATGSQLARSLTEEIAFNIIGFLDDNPDLHNHIIQGYRVYSPGELPKLLKKKKIDTVILAMASLPTTRKKEIVESLKTLSLSIKTIPTLEELLSGKVSISQIRNIDITELLGRDEVMPFPELLRKNITGKSVLVTGAGGSIGSQLCRQIAQLEPLSLILYEINEFALYSIDLELTEIYPDLNKIPYLGNILDNRLFNDVLLKYKVDTIYHAAAYKHVPLVEANPSQGIYNNVAGTLKVARCAIDRKVKNFVLISTDKAVRPTNIMGASKRVAELIIQALADFEDITTKFAIVRFGNVLDSSGSVVPRFRKQIATGKPITLTHPEITRYFMSIPEAVRLVIQAGALAQGGEVFLLDMGEQIKIYDLATQMINLSGLKVGVDIDIKITGLRPGEKLYEELLIDGDNIQPTKHPKIFSAYENKIQWKILDKKIKLLLILAKQGKKTDLICQLKNLVPEYKQS